MEKVNKITKADSIPIKKHFLLEDDFIITQNNELKAKNKVFSIYDFRFFENNTHKTPIIILINSENISKKMISLFGDMQALIVSSIKAAYNNNNVSKITNFIFDSQARNNLIKEHKSTKTENFINNSSNAPNEKKNFKLKKSLMEILLSVLADFLSAENTFLYDLALVFINGMLILEENFEDSKYKKSKIIIYLDEISFNIFELFLFIKKIKECILCIDLIIINSDNIIFKLDSFCMNQIYFPDNFITKKGIGLLPIQKSIISTKGFKWDVENWQTEYGKSLSTSNEMLENECRVHIEEGEIYFTAELLL